MITIPKDFTKGLTPIKGKVMDIRMKVVVEEDENDESIKE